MRTIKTIQWIGLGIVLAMALFVSRAGFSASADQTDSSRDASDAYKSLGRADEARDSEDWSGAVAAYREAMEKYRRLSTRRPDWEPEMVQYRIGYCTNQIQNISRATGKTVDELIAALATADTGDPEVYRERYHALLQENQYLRQRISEIEPASGEGTVPASVGDSSEIAERKANTEAPKTLPAAVTPAGAGAQTNEWAAQINPLKRERTTLAAENELLKQELQKVKSAARDRTFAKGLSNSADEVRRQMHDGLARERVGDFPAALGLYDKVISARPAYAEALKARGRCLLQMGKYEEAAAVFRRVATVNPGDPASRILLSVTFCLAGKFDQAIEVLTPLVVDNPSNALAQNALGAAWLGAGDTRAAKVALEKAVSLDPELADARFNLAQVLVAGGSNDTDRAREQYRKAIALGARPDPELQKLLGSP